MAIADTPTGTISSLIPARIDRLRWAPFHTRMVLALGTAWVLDGIKTASTRRTPAVPHRLRGGEPGGAADHRAPVRHHRPPQDDRGNLQIAVCFAIAQCFGAIGPVFYGWLIGEGGDPFKLFIGYLIGAGVMIVGGLVETFLGVNAEGQPLEHVATPLSAVTSRPRATG